MDRLQILGCLIFLFGFVFGNQPSHYLFSKQQSMFMTDWRNEIVRAKKIVLLNSEDISSVTTQDSIQMQKTPPDASRITFGKIVLEWVGAATGGLLLAIPISVLAGEDGAQWGYLFGFSIGPAIGTTFIGNKLMEPDGSFVKSLVGSTLGMLLGGGIYVGYVMSGIFSDNWEANNDEIWYLSLAIGLPILGATAGYNLGIPEISGGTINFNENFNDFNKITQLQRAKYKLLLISVKF